MRLSNCASALIIAFASSTLTATFAADGADWMDEDGPKLPEGVTTNDTVMIKKDSSPFALILQAEALLKSDKPDKAIEVIRRSLDLNMEDADAHLIYAKALERKLEKQKVEDPALFNKCVKEWLAVLRNTYGDEKGETFRGVGIPGINGRFWEDEDRHKPARQHLIKLTGTSPKVWETNDKFMAKVARSGTGTVSGKIIKAESESSDKAAPKKTADSKPVNATK